MLNFLHDQSKASLVLYILLGDMNENNFEVFDLGMYLANCSLIVHIHLCISKP